MRHVLPGTVVFLSYGEGPHIAETAFAVLSAWRRCRTDAGVELLIYTDRPGDFVDVPVPVRTITETEMREWQPTGAYPRRCKTAVIRDALQTLDRPVVLVDSDTWFRRSPGRILDRVSPGRVALHMDEGPLVGANDDMKRAFIATARGRTFHDSHGREVSVGADDGMWNSGVTGIHPMDAALLDDTLALVDQFWRAFPQGIFLEQFALSSAVDRVARPLPTDDVVYHYWVESLRRPWRSRLPQLLAETADLPPGARADLLHRHRPRTRGLDAAKFAAKKAWRSMGRQTASVRSSAT